MSRNIPDRSSGTLLCVVSGDDHDHGHSHGQSEQLPLRMPCLRCVGVYCTLESFGAWPPQLIDFETPPAQLIHDLRGSEAQRLRGPDSYYLILRVL